MAAHPRLLRRAPRLSRARGSRQVPFRRCKTASAVSKRRGSQGTALARAHGPTVEITTARTRKQDTARVAGELCRAREIATASPLVGRRRAPAGPAATITRTAIASHVWGAGRVDGASAPVRSRGDLPASAYERCDHHTAMPTLAWSPTGGTRASLRSYQVPQHFVCLAEQPAGIGEHTSGRDEDFSRLDGHVVERVL